MTYNVLMGTLNPTQSLTHLLIKSVWLTIVKIVLEHLLTVKDGNVKLVFFKLHDRLLENLTLVFYAVLYKNRTTHLL